MAIKSKAGIYQILEDRLKATGSTPLTCVDLYDDAEIAEHAANANKVSDFLGHMWRRGLLQRWYNPRDSTQKARFAYTWKDESPVVLTQTAPPKIEQLNIIRNQYAKPHVTITEDDACITLDFEQFTITVQRKT